MEEKGELLIHLINEEGVYRTAPATPGLLNIHYFVIRQVVLLNFLSILVAYLFLGNLANLCWLKYYKFNLYEKKNHITLEIVLHF